MNYVKKFELFSILTFDILISSFLISTLIANYHSVI